MFAFYYCDASIDFLPSVTATLIVKLMIFLYAPVAQRESKNPGVTYAWAGGKEQRPVQMMFQKATFNMACVSEVQAQLLELPYAGQELSMLVLLPDDGVDLSSVEESLTFEKVMAWTKPECMRSTDVEVFLPTFKLQENYDMESVLQHLGIVDAFAQGKADLSAMAAETDLCLSKFMHKSFVEVNEEGTEAAAASAVMFVEYCLVSRPRFCADHPFLFFIRHNRTNTLLFCGRFSSP
ncbi:serpin B9-like [Tupaia chinensis]|uniref:serpin B9-like n=1 Tax=Tupaia chinensis TaxID=246437 RepID=UPI0003C8D9A8|nr:serpin B9-like [Tupaia chinensis]